MKLHITEEAVKDLRQDNSGKLLVHDTEVAGFGLNVSRHGPTSYIIKWRDEAGRQKYESIGAFGAISAEVARAKAKDLLSKVKSKEEGRTPKASPTLDNFFFHHFFPRKRSRNGSYDTTISLYTNHIQPSLGAWEMGVISEGMVLDLQHHLRQKRPKGGRRRGREAEPLAEGTVRRILIILRNMYAEALEDGVAGVTANPTRPLDLSLDRDMQIHRALTYEQARLLVGSAQERGHHQLADMLAMAFATGLRAGNVLRLRWDWVDFERGMIMVPPQADKAKRGYNAFLPQGALDRLWERWAETTGPYVYPNPRTGRPYDSCYKSWNTVRLAAGLPEARFHDLRHSFATWMLHEDADVTYVQKALGHTQIKTTMIYLDHFDEVRQQQANRVGDRSGLFGPAMDSAATESSMSPAS